MKTLDEVIKALKLCNAQNENLPCCRGCPYENSSCRFGMKADADALHYLKEYQKYQDTMCALPDYYDWIHSVDNPPLTWDELKQMEGKPVWVECKYYSQWAIIGEVCDDRIRFYGYKLLDGEPRFQMGKIWQAYRKERTA